MTHLTEIILWIVLVLLLVLSAFFSSSETALMTVNRYRLRHRIRKGHRSAFKVLDLLKHPDRFLGLVLIGNTIANIVASALMTILATHLFGSKGIAIATGILTLCVLIFSEIAPKTIAANYAEQVALVFVWPLEWLLKIFYPIVWILNTVTNQCLRWIGLNPSAMHAADRLSPEELSTIVSESADSLPEVHKTMLVSILELSRMFVEDIMLPRNKIQGIDLKSTLSSMTSFLLHYRQDYVPVYEQSIDHVVGVLDVRDAFRLMATQRWTKKNLLKIIEKPYFVPEATSINLQWHQFRVLNRSHAFVVDEYGDIQGWITLEDILEEVVGHVESEVAPFSTPILREASGDYILSGTLAIREINKQLGFSLPEYGPKTLSGLVLEALETLPDGPVCIQLGDYQIEVLQFSDSLLLKLRVHVIERASEE